MKKNLTEWLKSGEIEQDCIIGNEPEQPELLPAGWKIDCIQQNKPITTVGDLMDRLKNYSREVPVLIDAYEVGYQKIKNVYLHEVKKCNCAGGCIGEYEDSYIQDDDGHPTVLISRN